MTQLNNPQAQSLMTRSVVTVLPTTQVREIAQILCERGISAVPVVDATGRVLGLVTEADLIRRLAGLDDAPLGWLGGLFADPAKRAERYARTHGMVAEDIMTQNVVSVAGNTPASAIAQLMEQNNIRRVLVIDGGQMAGIVSRADLLHALTMPQEEAPGLVDEHIRQAVMEAIDLLGEELNVKLILNAAPRTKMLRYLGYGYGYGYNYNYGETTARGASAKGEK